MVHTKQKTQKDPDLSKEACSKCEICTFQPKACQKDAPAFQEKLAFLQKIATTIYGLVTEADCISLKQQRLQNPGESSQHLMLPNNATVKTDTTMQEDTHTDNEDGSDSEIELLDHVYDF